MVKTCHATLAQGGELPPSWGSNTTFANLKALILRGNQLQGGLPASWAEPAAFTSLDHLDVSGTPRAPGCLATWNHGTFVHIYSRQCGTRGLQTSGRASVCTPARCAVWPPSEACSA